MPKINITERVGFEPTAHCGVTDFQDQLLKPLGHLSKNNSDVSTKVFHYYFLRFFYGKVNKIIVSL